MPSTETGYVDIRFTFGKDEHDAAFLLWTVQSLDGVFPDGLPDDGLEYARESIWDDPHDLVLDIDRCLKEAVQ